MSCSFILFSLYLSFVHSYGVCVCVRVGTGIGAHAPKNRRRKITNARQQEHDTHQTENKRLELNIRVPCDCCRVCVIVCSKNARTLVRETTALTTFSYIIIWKQKTFRNRFRLWSRALISTISQIDFEFIYSLGHWSDTNTTLLEK